MKTEVLFALNTLKKVTQIPAQKKIQTLYLNKYYRRYLVRLYKKNTLFKYLFFFEIYRIYLFSALKLKVSSTDDRVLFFYSTANQKRQIDFVKNTVQDYNFSTISACSQQPISLLKNVSPRLWWRVFWVGLRLYRLLYKRVDAIDQKTMLLFIFFYTSSLCLLQKKKPNAVLVSNDHSSHPLGFACAARALGIKTIYIQHAHVTRDMPALRFDTAILDGMCASDIYKTQGSVDRSEIVFRGIEGEERPMNTTALKTKDHKKTVGLFINVCDRDVLLKTLNLLAHRDDVQKVLLREHPAFPVDLGADAVPEKIVVSPRGRSLWDDALKCDVVISGNSSLHLSVLKYGVPSIFWNDLDYISYDDYGFASHDICFDLEHLNTLDFQQVAMFYDNTSWVERFQYFDESYQRNNQDIHQEIRKSILQYCDDTHAEIGKT